MLCNISQNAMGQPLGGVPCQVQPGGYPAQGGTLAEGTLVGDGDTLAGGTLAEGGTLAGAYPGGGGRVPWQGVPWWGGTLAGGYPGQVPPQQGTPLARSGGGDTQLGQHREYLLHGGRYASCVHTGGLSYFALIFTQPKRLRRLMSDVSCSFVCAECIKNSN